MKKRILSLLLVGAMLVCAMPALFLAGGAADNQVAFTASFYEEAQAGKITYDTETAEVSYGGAWKAGFFLKENTGAMTIVPLSRICPKVANLAMTESSYTALLANPGWDPFYWGSPNGSGMLNLDNYGFAFGNLQCINLYQYQVAEEGTFNLSVEIDHYVPTTYTYYFAVMVNQVMVWPTVGADYTYNGSYLAESPDTEGIWFHVTPETTVEEINDALQTLRATIKKGDTVEFCYRFGDTGTAYKGIRENFAICHPKLTASTGEIKKVQYVRIMESGKLISTTAVEDGLYTLPAYTGTETFVGWDVNGDGAIDYLPGTQLNISGWNADIVNVNAITVGTSRWIDNLPELDANGVPTYIGGWQTGAYSTQEGVFKLFGNLNTDGILCIESSPWGSTGGGLYRTGRTSLIALSGCYEGGPFLSEINWTADYNGSIEFGLDKIVLKAEGGSTDYIAYNFAVYKNGEKIWPTDTEWFHSSTDEPSENRNAEYDAMEDFTAAGFPLSITVEKGDVISFRTQQGNTNTWMLYAQPTVTYTALSESPLAVKADLTLDTDLDMNFYLTVVNGRDNVELGLEYWTMQPTESMLEKGGKTLEGRFDEKSGFYVFSYGNLTAKQMADTVYIRPYSYVGDDVIYGAVSSFSIRQYAETVLGQSDAMDKLLGSLLSYGAQAQLLFDYNNATENLANANVADDFRSLTFNDTLNNVYAQGEGENPITSASLLLNNRVGMKFVVKAVEGAETYVLEYAKDAAFTDAKTVEMVSTRDGEEKKASFDLTFAELGDTFYVRAVIDGEAGATLTYSFESYFDRVQADCDDGLYGLLSALANFERGLANYQ